MDLAQNPNFHEKSLFDISGHQILYRKEKYDTEMNWHDIDKSQSHGTQQILSYLSIRTCSTLAPSSTTQIQTVSSTFSIFDRCVVESAFLCEMKQRSWRNAKFGISDLRCVFQRQEAISTCSLCQCNNFEICAKNKAEKIRGGIGGFGLLHE